MKNVIIAIIVIIAAAAAVIMAAAPEAELNFFRGASEICVSWNINGAGSVDAVHSISKHSAGILQLKYTTPVILQALIFCAAIENIIPAAAPRMIGPFAAWKCTMISIAPGLILRLDFSGGGRFRYNAGGIIRRHDTLKHRKRRIIAAALPAVQPAINGP